MKKIFEKPREIIQPIPTPEPGSVRLQPDGANPGFWDKRKSGVVSPSELPPLPPRIGGGR
jgi:hypothetical protein